MKPLLRKAFAGQVVFDNLTSILAEIMSLLETIFSIGLTILSTCDLILSFAG